MAGKPTLQWTKPRVDTLKREIANYNKRLKRAQIKYPKIEMPQPIKFKEVKEGINTRDQYTKLVNKLKRATAKSLVPSSNKITTKWAEDELKREQKKSKSKQKREKRRKLLQEIDTSRRAGRLYSDRDLLIRNLVDKKGRIQLETLERWLDKNNLAKSEQWRQNYINTIESNIQWSKVYGYEESAQLLEQLRDKIIKMDLIDFLIAQLRSSSELSIGELIPSPPQDGMFDIDYTRDLRNDFERLGEVWFEYG